MKGRLRKLLQKLQFPLILGLILALIISSNLFSACATKQVTLRLIMPNQEFNAMMRLAQQFENENPGINIRINQGIRTTDDLSSDFLKHENINRFNQGQVELFYMDIIWLAEFADKKMLMDLQKDFKQEELNGFLYKDSDAGKPNYDDEPPEYTKEIKNEMYYDQKLYRIPFRSDVSVLFFNKDLLKDVGELRKTLGVPKTFDDIINISKEVKADKKIKFGYLWQGANNEALVAMFLDLLYSSGGTWIDIENRTVGLNEQPAIDAVNFLLQTIDSEISPSNFNVYDESKTYGVFKSGQAAFMRSWPAWLKSLNNNGLQQQNTFAITAVTHADEKPGSKDNPESVACRGGWGFAIPSNTKYYNEALKLVKFLTSPASQEKFTLEYGSLPSRRNLLSAPKIVAEYPHYPKIISKILETSKTRPLLPKYAEAAKILRQYLTQALNAKDDAQVEPIMRTAAQETWHLINPGKTLPADLQGN